MKLYSSYADVQNELNAGDVIAFVGNNKYCNPSKHIFQQVQGNNP